MSRVHSSNRDVEIVNTLSGAGHTTRNALVARRRAAYSLSVDRSPRRSPTIAFADRFVDEQEMYIAGLIARGLRVVTIDDEDPFAAALTIGALNPQAVVTRLCPELFGIELTRCLREHRAFAETPVVLLTTHGDTETHDLARAAGVTAIYVLPLTPHALADALVLLTDYQPA